MPLESSLLNVTVFQVGTYQPYGKHAIGGNLGALESVSDTLRENDTMSREYLSVFAWMEEDTRGNLVCSHCGAEQSGILEEVHKSTCPRALAFASELLFGPDEIHDEGYVYYGHLSVDRDDTPHWVPFAAE